MRLRFVLVLCVSITGVFADWVCPPGWRTPVQLPSVCSGVDLKLPQIACSNTGDIHVTYEIVNLDCNVPSYTRSLRRAMGLDWELLQSLTQTSESYWSTVLAHQDTVWTFSQEKGPRPRAGMKLRYSLDRGASLSDQVDVDVGGSLWA